MLKVVTWIHRTVLGLKVIVLNYFQKTYLGETIDILKRSKKKKSPIDHFHFTLIRYKTTNEFHYKDLKMSKFKKPLLFSTEKQDPEKKLCVHT